MSSKNLNKAREVKDDEFYTQRKDVDEMLHAFRSKLKGARVYCNCDSAEDSEIYKHLLYNFTAYGLRSLAVSGCASRIITIHEKDDTRYIDAGEYLRFESAPAVEMLRASDVVITNPPFSLMRKFIQLLVDNKKDFIIIAAYTLTTTNIYMKLYKAGQIFKVGHSKGMGFVRPDGSIKRVNATWFSSFDIGRLKKLEAGEDNGGGVYYDDHHAINRDRIKDITKTRETQGVPITIFEYDLRDFEIVGVVDTYIKGVKKFKRVFIKYRGPS